MGRRVWAVAIAAAMAMVGFGPAGAAPPARQDVVVVFDDDVRDPRAAAADVARQYDARLSHVYEHAVVGFAASIPEGRRAALERDPRVVRVDDDLPVHATAQTVPTGVNRISAPAAHGTSSGAKVSVGILDTGIRTHGDLAVAAGGRNCTDTGGTSTDDVHGHGTHVAGTVAALNNTTGVLGVAPAVSLVPVKVLNDSGSGQWSWIICGLDHAASTGIDVVNLSLSGSGSWDGTPCPGSASLHRAVCGAIAAGTTVVVAAGNDGRDASTRVPAAYPEAVTVSALEDRNGVADSPGYCSGRGPWQTCEDVLASFSNHGSIIDVIAPGVAILSTTNDGKTGSKSGTSMAAPHVAGVAALIIAEHGPITPQAVRDHLLATGQCPDTTQAADGACAGQAWPRDPDGIAEPLVHAAWAASQAPGSGGGGGPVANTAPTASFGTPACTDLACSFTDTSTDEDGTVVAWAWDLGDETTSTAQHPTHTYAAGGTYTVTLVVTDDDGATSAPASATVTVTEPTTGTDDWDLDGTGDKVKGEKLASLTWTPSAATAVAVYVDGLMADATTPNDGNWGPYSLGKGGGTHTFQVCDAGGTTNCSAIVRVSF